MAKNIEGPLSKEEHPRAGVIGGAGTGQPLKGRRREKVEQAQIHQEIAERLPTVRPALEV
jgi:hypothetical protein